MGREGTWPRIGERPGVVSNAGAATLSRPSRNPSKVTFGLEPQTGPMSVLGHVPTFERECRFTAGNQTQFRAAANAHK